jgi:hypothetical protein
MHAGAGDALCIHIERVVGNLACSCKGVAWSAELDKGGFGKC